MSATSAIRYESIFAISTRAQRIFPLPGKLLVPGNRCRRRRARTVFMCTVSRSLQSMTARIHFHRLILTSRLQLRNAISGIAIGVTGRYKQGIAFLPGGTFTYVWEARGPASAGVWSYHDHSICDMENVSLGAIGMIVVHNPADKENEVKITADRLPDGSWTGSPVRMSGCCGPGLKLACSQSQLALLVNPTESAQWIRPKRNIKRRKKELRARKGR